jgi:hypothetical protein
MDVWTLCARHRAFRVPSSNLPWPSFLQLPQFLWYTQEGEEVCGLLRSFAVSACPSGSELRPGTDSKHLYLRGVTDQSINNTLSCLSKKRSIVMQLSSVGFDVLQQIFKHKSRSRSPPKIDWRVEHTCQTDKQCIRFVRFRFRSAAIPTQA